MSRHTGFQCLETRVSYVLNQHTTGPTKPQVSSAASSTIAVNGHRAALVDLGELTFCDISGVRELVRLHQALRAQLGAVTFRNATPVVRRVVDLTRADIELTLDASDPSE